MSERDARSEQDPAPRPRPELHPALLDVLERSKDLGFLGPGPVVFHVEHARGFTSGVGDAGTLLDLGSGGGVPGLVLALELPHTRVVLLDAMARRCRFLERAAGDLGLEDRVEVRCGRAEQLAHDPDLRQQFDVVVTRGFGPPAVTAECAAGFLRGVGARLLVSDPPAGPDGPDGSAATRWPADGLAVLGLQPADRLVSSHSTIQMIRVVREVDARTPRRTGVPAKRPVF